MKDRRPVCPARFAPFDDRYLADPYPVFDTMRADGGVHHDPELDVWVLTRYEDIEAVFRDPELFSAANAQDPIRPLDDSAVAILAEGFRPIRTMSNLDGPEHTRIRRHNQVGFSPRRLRAMESVVRETAVDLIEHITAGQPVDIVAALTFPLPATIIFRLLGFPPDDTLQLKAWCGDRMSFSWGKPDVEAQCQIAHDMVAYWQYCERHIERRFDDPADDFTSDLLAIHHDDSSALSLHEITHIVYGLSFAGHETTTNLLSNTIRRLLDQRSLWEGIVADRALIAGTVDEALRHDSSVIAWRRITTAAAELGGVAIPAGSKLLLMLGAANHDPTVFADPHAFDPTRTNAGQHLAFGWGKHYCLGATLTKIEVEVVIDELASRVPHLRLVDQEYTFHPNVSFRGPQHLVVVP